jgi:hypothetical protein
MASCTGADFSADEGIDGSSGSIASTPAPTRVPPDMTIAAALRNPGTSDFLHGTTPGPPLAEPCTPSPLIFMTSAALQFAEIQAQYMEVARKHGAAQTADDGIKMIAVSIKPAREPGHRPGSIIPAFVRVLLHETEE